MLKEHDTDIEDFNGVDKDAYEAATNEAIDSIFSDEPEHVETEEVIDEELDEVTPDDVDDTPKDDDTQELNDEIDFDAPLEKPKKEEEVPGESQTGKGGNPLRPHLERAGREAKEFKAKFQEAELELERLRAENSTLRGEVDTYQATRIDPASHPEVVAHVNKVRNNLTDFSVDLSDENTRTLTSKLGEFIDEYNVASRTNEADRRAALRGFKNNLYRHFGEDKDVLEDGEDAPFDPTVDRIYRFVSENSSIMRTAAEKAEELQHRAKNKTLAVGAEEYEKSIKTFDAVLEPLGKLPDEVIEANPYKPEAVVAKLVRDNPEAARRAEQAKQAIKEAFFGKKPLTQSEVDSIVANFEGEGDALKEFYKSRATAEKSLKTTMMNKLFLGIMLLSDYEEKARGYEKYKAKSDAIDSEIDALDGVSKQHRSSEPTKNSDEYVDPRSLPSVEAQLIKDIFG